METSTHYRLPEFEFVPPPELAPGAGGQQRKRHSLVIVGAGLAGLTLAADLASRGVACTVLDEDNTVGVRGASSRGIAYMQKTLEIMARVGIYERIAAKGTRWSVGKVLSGPDVLYEFDFQPASVSLQPPFVNIQQFYLEWYLVDRLLELGLTDLRWKNKVTGARNLDDRVELDVQTPAGAYTLEADWVVDAEGVNSAVRQLLQLREHTERGLDRWCITDVKFTHKRLNERWTWVEAPFNDNRGVWQHLMADQVWRLDFQMAPDADPAYVSRHDVARERVRAMLGPDVDFEIVWVGAYSYRTMLMERFRHGRLVFIGDAAHAKSPFGARGGNSGIADADNLGWKLQLLLQGRAGPEILDTYHLERHRAAQENIRITSRSGRFMQPRSPMEFTLRQAVVQLAREQYAFARGLVNTGRMMSSHHYGGLPTVGPGPQDGRLIPNVPLRAGGRDLGLVDVLRETGCEHAAFVFPAAGSAPALGALAAATDGLPVRLWVVGRDVEDPQGLLAAQAGTAPGGIALVRPDGHLATALARHDGAALAAAVRRSLGQSLPVTS
ncbi:FAD-dependent oxidoreductase [Ramlibacter sp. MAHUQ-53]|uniref:FAD-dependent oxidoreductase n=1 Tax=unclassified Ramlibacter TaxID=2617605 RepID=UPI00362738F5